jgi:hypothetical protein
MQKQLVNLRGTNLEQMKRAVFLDILMMARFCPSLMDKLERVCDDIIPLLKEISRWSPEPVGPHDCGFSKNIPDSFEFVLNLALFAPHILLESEK